MLKQFCAMILALFVYDTIGWWSALAACWGLAIYMAYVTEKDKIKKKKDGE